jgi:DNA-binding CsgD family transcriptional regulator
MTAQSASVEDLMRLLVERTGKAPAGQSESEDAEEIVIDVIVDGARYLLVRLPKPLQESAHLSPREQEIVRLVAMGHSNKIIGDVLNISSWTVCTHLRRIFAKIGVGSRAAMVARLIGTGVRHPARAAAKRAGQNGCPPRAPVDDVDALDLDDHAPAEEEPSWSTTQRTSAHRGSVEMGRKR